MLFPIFCMYQLKTKKEKKSKYSQKKMAKHYLDASTNKNIDIVIELIGGAEGAAKKLVFSALKNKKHVITAIKP